LVNIKIKDVVVEMLFYEHSGCQQAFKTRQRDYSLSHTVFVSMFCCIDMTCWTLYNQTMQIENDCDWFQRNNKASPLGRGVKFVRIF